VVFDAKKNVGDVKIPIRIATDLGDKFGATVTAYATILPNESQPTAKDSSSAPAAANAGTAATGAAGSGNVARQ
jgi:hypothetical protein